jgi:hypothetical protein
VHYVGDTFEDWYGLAATGAVRAPELEVLQVFAPAEWFCAEHGDAQPVLADPTARVDVPRRPNRAARRSRRR